MEAILNISSLQVKNGLFMALFGHILMFLGVFWPLLTFLRRCGPAPQERKAQVIEPGIFVTPLR